MVCGYGIWYVDTVEEHVSFAFRRTFKDFKILEDLRIDFDGVKIANTILPEKVECDFIRWFKCDMLVAKGTTTHCISLIITFFIPCSESEDVDEIHSRRTLSNLGILILQVSCVILSDRVDVVLQPVRQSPYNQKSEVGGNTFNFRDFSYFAMSD